MDGDADFTTFQMIMTFYCKGSLLIVQSCSAEMSDCQRELGTVSNHSNGFNIHGLGSCAIVI